MLSAIIVVSVIAVLAIARRGPVATQGGRLGHPAVWLGLVTALIYLNQVLFTIYVLRVRHGDPGFIARYLPSGWFALDRGAVMRALARHVPFPWLLTPSVLRVQAFLELPFVMFAYLSVCRWFGVYGRAAALVWPASIGWTATFCLIEWDLHNPDTTTDLVVRAVSCVAVPPLVRRLTPPPAAQGDGHGVGGLLLFAVSAGALGWLILVVYDTALLYNLGHLRGRLPGAVAAAIVLAAARRAARRADATSSRPGPGIATISRSFGLFLVLFFVPALPVRYGISFGSRNVAVAACLVLLAAATVRGSRDTLALHPGGRRWWAVQMIVAVTAGLAGAAVAADLASGYREARLLWAAGAFLAAATVTCWLLDRLTSRQRSRPGPEARPADDQAGQAEPLPAGGKADADPSTTTSAVASICCRIDHSSALGGIDYQTANIDSGVF